MFGRFRFFLICCSVFSSVAFSAEATRPLLLARSIVPLLKRVLTHGEASYYHLDALYRNAFLGRNIVNLPSFLHPSPHRFSPSNGSAHQEFHELLYERMLGVSRQTMEDQKRPVGRDEDMMPGVGNPFKAAMRDAASEETRGLHRLMARRRPDFIEGHFIHLAGVTEVPLVGIHMRACTNDAPIRYICPIEYVWQCSTFCRYREETCLLKVWADYSDLYLVGIPKGAYVDIKIGLNAPQAFPKFNKSVYAGNIGERLNLADGNADDVSHRLNRALLSEEDIDKMMDIVRATRLENAGLLTEHFHGGRAQVLIGTAEKYDVVHLGSLLSDAQKREIIESRSKANGQEYAYLTRRDYDDRPLDIPGMLCGKKLITNDELDELKTLRM